MQTLYPEIDPFHHFYLDTDDIHQVYVEQCGNPAGFPVVFLHGGPCSGCRPEHRRFFNPEQYHIILLDQRGSGRSRPFGALEQNNTQALINDLENIRKRLKISTWLLFAGSWGATLALLYAQQYPERVAGLILRGVFLARQRDMDWFIEGSAGRIYPECWQKLVSSVRLSHPKHLLEHLVQAVFSSHKEEREAAALAWADWGAQTALGPLYPTDTAKAECDETLLRQVRMELHYAHNHYFIEDNQILDNCHLIQHIPTHIIHGRLDLVCPAEAGFSLSKALPKAKLEILPNSGHIAAGDEMIDALITATDNFLQQV
ncbi:prolyl aminopeptidase [methane-oxidizing endosymbiont of Gigantopelta aegis]|uniref:prolyl aminopeptidase n=1 Tax=methane-oxidizing endosymbiont of Gigantopelta aegis TaxID=2794938 RepID=UPI0018DCAB9A|nr:prolyl aminopeptidase [methane-oxidizing endosymbiont of Gigantopelta aegis]